MQIFVTPKGSKYHILRTRLEHPGFPYKSSQVKLIAYCSSHCAEEHTLVMDVDILGASILGSDVVCEKCFSRASDA